MGSEAKILSDTESETRAANGASTSRGVWLAGGIASGTTRAPSTWRILLIFDDPDLGDWLLEELRQTKAAVALATKARQGLAFARSEIADVIIAEMGLPDLPGMDLLRELRGLAKMPKVILTTGRHSDFLANRAIEQGATAVLSKPFSIEQLLALLTNVLAN